MMWRLILISAIFQLGQCSCPSGLELVNNECRGWYAMIPTYWDEAADDVVAKCEEVNGYPIIIHNEEQESYWRPRITKHYDWTVIGLVCNPNSMRYEWADGSPVDYTPPTYYDPQLFKTCRNDTVWILSSNLGDWEIATGHTAVTTDVYCTTREQASTNRVSPQPSTNVAPWITTRASPPYSTTNLWPQPSSTRVSQMSTTNQWQQPSSTRVSPQASTTRVQSKSTLPTNAPATNGTVNQCKCGFTDDDWFDDWDPSLIWVDVIVVLDTSKSMGSSLEEAKSVITAFVGLMTTDTSAEFYSRIGVIAMSDTVEVVYNLNMNSTDDLDMVQQHKIDKIDVGAAFQAALKMFADGSKLSSYRENAQQIIYYMTNSAPGANMNGVDDFKTGGGIIIVNDYILEGDVGDPGLQKLASDNFFFTDLSENYIYSLGVFCEANCFCTPDAHPFNDDELNPRTRANRGCFHPVNNGIPQQKARDTCQKEHASLVSIHDSDKEFFVNSVVSIFGPKKKFWLGLQNDGTQWNWDDKSTDPYSDWDVANGQPNTKGNTLMCAYAQQGTGFNTPWTAANCAAGGVIYVCESPPCSVGYKKCS